MRKSITPNQIKEITILKSGGNYDILDNMANVRVIVNNQDITANTETSPIPEGSTGLYYFNPETGVLGYKGVTALNDNYAKKDIKHIEYYDALGKKVTRYHMGYTLQQVTYTDGTVEHIKVFKFEK